MLFGVRKIKFSFDYFMCGKMYKDMFEIYFDVVLNIFKDNLVCLVIVDSKVWSVEVMWMFWIVMDEYE